MRRVRCQSLLRDGPQGSEAAAPLLGGARPQQSDGDPACFVDLHLDRIVERVTTGRAEYGLRDLYRRVERDVATIRYRHEVVADLERPDIAAVVSEFAGQMGTVRRWLEHARRVRPHHQRQRFRLDAMAAYCDAVAAFDDALTGLDLRSRGLRGARSYVATYAASEAFREFADETASRLAELGDVTYCVWIKGARVTVRPFDGEADLSAEIRETFAKFRAAAPRDYHVAMPQRLELNDLEARILGLVATQHPAVFGAVDAHCDRYCDFIDAGLAGLEREAQFYLAYLDHIAPLRAAGLSFCLPEVSADDKRFDVRGAFDLALADTVARSGERIVTNDVDLREGERALVVTGPNQGGKTTFARMVGGLCHLAGLGLPVPGRHARVFLPDRVLTHFEREETLASLRGKLEDDLERMRAILDEATPDSLVVVNEAFTSTSVADALELSAEVLGELLERDLVCVYVTFLDELSRLSSATVSLVTAVDPDDPAVRTFRVERRPADGLAYAAAIADKHGLTYAQVRERVTG